jgi:hypothetical protein
MNLLPAFSWKKRHLLPDDGSSKLVSIFQQIFKNFVGKLNVVEIIYTSTWNRFLFEKLIVA